MESGESGDCMSRTQPKDDLISRSAALEAIDCWHIDFNSMDGAKVQSDCWRAIKELPAVDAALVVRCKDCIYWDKGHTEECDNSDSICFRNGWCKPDWFCADGERSDECETGDD